MGAKCDLSEEIIIYAWLHSLNNAIVGRDVRKTLTECGLGRSLDSTHLSQCPDHDLVEAELRILGRPHVDQDDVAADAAAGGRRVRSGSDPLGLRPARCQVFHSRRSAVPRDLPHQVLHQSLGLTLRGIQHYQKSSTLKNLV